MPLPLAEAQEFRLPGPGVMVDLSPPLNPPVLTGIKVHTDNPFRFDFILDRGDSVLGNDQLKEISAKLIRYFLASITIPEKELWVNLSPYEQDRIIPQSFGLTEMGRDLLAEDYLLKQVTASLIYPESQIGKKFWKRIYEQAAKKFGTTNIAVNTFNKVWILPEKAVVYENANSATAYVTQSKLKVMLEKDYLSFAKHVSISPVKREIKNNDVNFLGSQTLREIILPEISREVNNNKNFATLREVYNSLILATWYKKKIKGSILAQVYEDKNKVKELSSPNALIGDPQHIYQQYLKAFKKGVYNYIKEDIDISTQQKVARKYFAGGITALHLSDEAMVITHTRPINQSSLVETIVDLAAVTPNDQAGVSPAWMNGTTHQDYELRRRDIFGGGIDEWLKDIDRQATEDFHLRTEQRKQLIGQLLQNQEFLALIENNIKDDLPVAIIRYAVKNKIFLQTRDLGVFLRDLRNQAPEYLKSHIVSALHLSTINYVDFLTKLSDPSIQHYLNSDEFLDLKKEDALMALADRIDHLPDQRTSITHAGVLYAALPGQLSAKAIKANIQVINLPLARIREIRDKLKTSQTEKLLKSENFLKMRPKEKVEALTAELNAQGVRISEAECVSVLPFHVALGLNKNKFLYVGERPLARVSQGKIKDNIIFDNKALREDQVSQNIFGRQINSWSGFHVREENKDQLMETARDLTGRQDFLELLGDTNPDDIALAVVRYCVQHNINPGTPRLDKLLAAIKASVPGELSIKLRNIEVSIIEFVRLISILGRQDIQKELDSSSFYNLPREDKIYHLALAFRQRGFPVRRLDVFRSTLPQRLSEVVWKADINAVELTLDEFENVRKVLAGGDIQYYLNSNEFRDLSAEEKFVELFGRMSMSKRLLDSLSDKKLSKIYDALPEKLTLTTDRVYRQDLLEVTAPLKVLSQVREAIANPRIQDYLNSEQFLRLEPGDKLAALVEKIIQEKLSLDTTSLASIYTCLPHQLTIDTDKVYKSQIIFVKASLEDYRTIRAATNDVEVKAFISSEEFNHMPKQDRLAALVDKMREHGFIPRAESLSGIYTALPSKLKERLTIRGIDKAMLVSSAFEKGGIDLTAANMNLQTLNSGVGIKFHIDPAMLEKLQNASGFVISRMIVQPLPNLQEFLE